MRSAGSATRIVEAVPVECGRVVIIIRVKMDISTRCHNDGARL